MSENLTHLSKEGHIRMVDVSEKATTRREATAETLVCYSQEAWDKLKAADFQTKKGALGEIARIAGTMAAKKTAEWIPLCHTLPLQGCEINVEPLHDDTTIRLTCHVITTAQTGVEMEALTGVSGAALTLYDMTKSLGHGIVIKQTRLLSKRGGKSDYQVE
ncbi:cyclic pyranopterin monophosphate synthase MoaC [Rubellicoccus peritrichatus]|uniref:cyclic pyranopterin monophosphate synthase n=1 Tax=Rubellicoccus peritrichatus TaxID=3080537 RepID=A0AAQ3LCF7_9BACT|nr:cyclic pyranopterin monophosphate synthase MoaC [Puniceicoccus sp. CR14]WOO42896.1 cyclic pyranopterin monophosphate synthase MoaC [Puniceicoccus sp. CR14]